MTYPSYCCKKCGEQIGWLGRVLRFTHGCKTTAAAIQEQQAIIQSLTARIEALEGN